MNPSPDQLLAIQRFRHWVETRVLTHQAAPCFDLSVVPGTQNQNELLIDSGRMVIQFCDNGFLRLMDVSRGSRTVVIYTDIGIEEVLLRGLTWAIERHFIDTYQS